MDPWRGFSEGYWRSEIDVREFIQLNYTPYYGDESFLEGPTENTKKLWEKVLALLEEEHKKDQLIKVK